MQEGKVGHVDTVHVAGDHSGPNIGRVVVAYVEHPVTFVLVCTQQFCLQRHMIGQQREGDNASILAKIFARVTCLERRGGCGKFLPVHTAVEHIHVNRVIWKDRQTGDIVADHVVCANQRGRT